MVSNIPNRAYNTFLKAASFLSNAEVMFEMNKLSDVKSFSSKAVIEAARAISIKFSNNEREPREGILQSLTSLPTYARLDALRLLEILKFIEHAGAKEALEIAREAIEIASALLI